MLESRKFFLIALAFALELFRNILLKDKRLKSIVALLLGAIETLTKTSSVIFLLLDERREAAVFAFVCLNFDLKLLRLLSKLLGESLEFEELPMLLTRSHESL